MRSPTCSLGERRTSLNKVISTKRNGKEPKIRSSRVIAIESGCSTISRGTSSSGECDAQLTTLFPFRSSLFPSQKIYPNQMCGRGSRQESVLEVEVGVEVGGDNRR